MNETLQSTLRKLRLSGLARTLDVRLQEAAGHGLTHGEFLELLVQDELAVRAERLLARRLKAAAFRDLKTLEDFDWQFNPSIKKKAIYDLATCRFVQERRDVLLLGPPGIGKSHLAQAIGYQAIKAGRVVLYRSIFDVVRDFLHDEAFDGQEKVLARYLKPDLLIIDSCAAPGYVEFLPGHPPEIRRIGPATAHNRGRSALLTMLQASRGSRYPSATEPTSALWSRLGRPWRSPRASSQGPLRRSDWSSPRSRGRANG